MKINSIAFTEGREGATPNSLNVTLDIKEAIWITLLAGKQRGTDESSLDLYNTLVGDVFNRYWDSGVDGAYRDHGDVVIPPIKYEETGE